MVQERDHDRAHVGARRNSYWSLSIPLRPRLEFAGTSPDLNLEDRSTFATPMGQVSPRRSTRRASLTSTSTPSSTSGPTSGLAMSGLGNLGLSSLSLSLTHSFRRRHTRTKILLLLMCLGIFLLAPPKLYASEPVSLRQMLVPRDPWWSGTSERQRGFQAGLEHPHPQSVHEGERATVGAATGGTGPASGFGAKGKAKPKHETEAKANFHAEENERKAFFNQAAKVQAQVEAHAPARGHAAEPAQLQPHVEATILAQDHAAAPAPAPATAAAVVPAPEPSHVSASEHAHAKTEGRLTDPWWPGDRDIMSLSKGKEQGVKAWNERELAAIEHCEREGNCREHQSEVVLFGVDWANMAMFEAFRGGEGVWSYSIIGAMRRLNYSIVFANDDRETMNDTLAKYTMVKDRTKTVLVNWAPHCFEYEECAYSEENPDGIPLWKLFWFSYFPWTWDPRFRKTWQVSADRSMLHDFGNTYFGFSYEDESKDHKFVPHSERPARALIHAKQASYFFFTDQYGRAWNNSYYPLALADPRLQDLDFNFRGTFEVSEHYMPEKMVPNTIPFAPDGIDNVGPVDADKFWEEVQNARILVGIGSPQLSPSPYVALAMGTPYLNPIYRWDPEDPWDRSKWATQQDNIALLDPPYVYHVHDGDYDGFVSAIRQAFDNPPTKGLILPDMTEEAQLDRVRHLLGHDWETEMRRHEQD